MVVTLGQHYNTGEKPTVILYSYIINHHAGTLHILIFGGRDVFSLILVCSFATDWSGKRVGVTRATRLSLVQRICLSRVSLSFSSESANPEERKR